MGAALCVQAVTRKGNAFRCTHENDAGLVRLVGLDGRGAGGDLWYPGSGLVPRLGRRNTRWKLDGKCCMHVWG